MATLKVTPGYLDTIISMCLSYVVIILPAHNVLRDIFTDKYLGLRNKGVLSLLSLLLKLVTVIIINQSCLDYSVMVIVVFLWYHEEVIITIYHKEVGYNFLEPPHNLHLYKCNLIKIHTWRVESYHFFKKGFTLLVSFQMVFAFWEQRSKMDPPESFTQKRWLR